MSKTSKSFYEDYRSKSNSLYRTLEQTTLYSCPCQNKNYKDFHGGINCLCTVQADRTVMDQYMKAGVHNLPPISKKKLGWKLG